MEFNSEDSWRKSVCLATRLDKYPLSPIKMNWNVFLLSFLCSALKDTRDRAYRNNLGILFLMKKLVGYKQQTRMGNLKLYNFFYFPFLGL